MVMPKWLARHGWLALLVMPVAALFAFSACSSSDEKTTGGATTAAAGQEPTFGSDGGVVIAKGGSISVGVTAVLSGDLVALGTTVLKAAELAQQQLGPVQGFPVKIISADDLCKSAGA